METTTSHRAEGSVRLRDALAAISDWELPADAIAAREHGLASARILADLEADDELVIATAIHTLLERHWIDREAANLRFGEHVIRLARELNQLGSFGLPAGWNPERGLDPGQAEALRKMLVAVVADVRLVLARLAEQLQSLRAARTSSVDARQHLGIETRIIGPVLAEVLHCPRQQAADGPGVFCGSHSGEQGAGSRE